MHTEEHRHSYGVIPFFKKGDTYEVLLIQQSRLGPEVWGFPKGTPEAGEKGIETAVRETREEVGIEVELVTGIEGISETYTFTERSGNKVHKRVTYYPAFVHTQEVALQESEVMGSEWVLLKEVVARLTHQETKRVFSEVVGKMGIG